MPYRAAVILVVTLALPSPVSSTQTAACAGAVATVESDPSRYRLRDGTRCEGVFVQGVAGSSSLRIASLTRHYESFSDTSTQPLRVAWQAPAGVAVQLHGYSLKSGLHYRMETVAPLSSGAYSWPTTVLRSLNMRKSDLGIVASARMSVGDSIREVLVPARVSQLRAAVDTSRLLAVVWSNMELSQVFVAVDALHAKGSPATVIQPSTELAYGVYPAGRGVPIRLPALPAAGIYHVRIGAVRSSGGSSTTSFLLFPAGP